ncbi:MAG: hypothetical protein Q8S03_01635 [Brevundimonas sp.]|uniref:hypothetical protein n=1 Tax=Brevundimonas sp. TaxID=1871086 RepID=UPI0027354620|nr:hypothetical protein [Brevundimonas sp.]MDP3403358.1 hypothetical protein [Brevundimonas sp.]
MVKRFSNGRARWIVLTPSADDEGWRREIAHAASAAGLKASIARALDGSGYGDPEQIFVTEDAALALAADPAAIIAILPEPETAPDAVAQVHGLPAPHSVWHASTLLARALDLARNHAIITATDLGRHPRLLRLFGDMEVVPPKSIAEASRRPAVAAAFSMYRDGGLADTMPIPWSEKLFVYDEKSARDWPEWGVLDVTGRPRMLVWGPYVALPAGIWRAVIRFSVDASAAGRQFRIDWGTRTACISEYVTPGRPGQYEIALDWAFEETDAAEIRVILTEGCFTGTLVFQGMTVQRMPPVPKVENRAA